MAQHGYRGIQISKKPICGENRLNGWVVYRIPCYFYYTIIL